MSTNRLVRRLVSGAVVGTLAIGAVSLSAAPAFAVVVVDPAVEAPATASQVPVGETATIEGFVISGQAASSVTAHLTSVEGAVGVPATSGVVIDAASTDTSLFITGSQTDLNTALAGLTFTRTGAGEASITLVTGGLNQFICPSNDHVYEVVSSGANWPTALSNSAAMFDGNAYLATITSAAENDCIFSGVTSATGEGRNTWFGATVVPDSGSQDWQWASGPEAGTTFWTGGLAGAAVTGMYTDWDRRQVGPQPEGDANQTCAQYSNALSTVPTWHDNNCGVQLKYVAEVAAEFATALPAATVEFAAVPAVVVVTPTASTTAALAATGVDLTATLWALFAMLALGTSLLVGANRVRAPRK